MFGHRRQTEGQFHLFGTPCSVYVDSPPPDVDSGAIAPPCGYLSYEIQTLRLWILTFTLH